LIALASSFFGHPSAGADIIGTRIAQRRRADAGPLLLTAR
jgi:hypothetical protein